MGRHVDDMPTVVLRNPRAKGRFAPASAAKGPPAVPARQRPTRAPRTTRTDRDRARKVDHTVEAQTPNANLVFIKNVPQHVAKTIVSDMLNAYNPVYVKRIHPEGKTTTVVSGYTSRAVAEQVHEHMNNLRLLDSVLQVELYQNGRSVQFSQGTTKALQKAKMGQMDEGQDEEVGNEIYVYNEEQLAPAPPLSTSAHFPALPTMQLRGDGRNHDVSPMKEWVAVRPPPASVEIASGMTILRKTPVATPTCRLPTRDDDALSGPTAVNDPPLCTSASTPIPKVQVNSVAINGLSIKGQIEHIPPTLPTFDSPRSAFNLPPTPPGFESRRQNLSIQDLTTLISAINLSPRTPPPSARESLFSPLEHMDTTSRVHHHHRHNCTFCGWLRERRLRPTPQAGAVLSAQDVDKFVQDNDVTARQEHQTVSRIYRAADQTHWRGMSESQIAARMERQRNVI